MEIRQSDNSGIYLLRLPGGVSAEELLKEMGGFAEERSLGHKGLTEALLEREKIYPTGMKAVAGVAIPHADREFTLKASIVAAALDSPVPFRPMGEGGDAPDVPAEAVFLLLMESSDKQLDLLMAIVDFIQDEDKMNALKTDAASDVLSASFGPFTKRADEGQAGHAK